LQQDRAGSALVVAVAGIKGTRSGEGGEGGSSEEDGVHGYASEGIRRAVVNWRNDAEACGFYSPTEVPEFLADTLFRI